MCRWAMFTQPRKLCETVGMTEEETRFFGLNRECGLHIDDALMVSNPKFLSERTKYS